MSSPVSAGTGSAAGAWLRALWAFSRPHTIIGSSLSVFGLYALAAAYYVPAGLDVGGLLLTWAACLGANVYIVGLNQLTDVEIDRINKPDLPLASGAFSMTMGRAVVATALGLSLVLGAALGTNLLVTILVSAGIGTAYSLPPLRLKRFHFWAAACVFTVRGVVVNTLLFRHFGQRLAGESLLPGHIWVLTGFVFGLSLVIAWFKDIPDMVGDDHHHIRTLSLQLGPERVFTLGMALLSACYLGVIAAGLLGLPGLNGEILAAGHGLALLLAWRLSRRVDPASPPAMTRFYMAIWALFFLEYVLFPLAAIVS